MTPNEHGWYIQNNNKGEKTWTDDPHLAWLQHQASQGNLQPGNELPLFMQTLRDYAPGGIPRRQAGPPQSVGVPLDGTPPEQPYLPDNGDEQGNQQLPPPGEGKGGNQFAPGGGKGGQPPPRQGVGKGGPQQPPSGGGKGGQPPPQQSGKGGGYNSYRPNYGGPYGGNNGAGKGGPDQPYQPAPSGPWMQGGYQGNYMQPYPSYGQNPYGSYDSGGGKGGNQSPPGSGKGGYAAGGKFADDPYHSNLKPNRGDVQRDVKKRERLGLAYGGSTSMDGKGGAQPDMTGGGMYTSLAGGKGGPNPAAQSSARVNTSMIPLGGIVPSDTGGPSEIMGKGGISYPMPTQSGKDGGYGGGFGGGYATRPQSPYYDPPPSVGFGGGAGADAGGFGFGGGGGYSTRPQNPSYSAMPPSGGFGGGFATRPQNPYYNPPQQPGYGKGGQGMATGQAYGAGAAMNKQLPEWAEPFYYDLMEPQPGMASVQWEGPGNPTWEARQRTLNYFMQGGR